MSGIGRTGIGDWGGVPTLMLRQAQHSALSMSGGGGSVVGCFALMQSILTSRAI